MKRKRPLEIHIFFLILSLLAVSCTEKETRPELNVRIFSVSGTVTGYVEDGPSVPVGCVTVKMSAYSVEDIGKTIPVYTTSFNTLDNGTYQFFKIWSEDCSGLFFDFTLTDSSPEREVHFSSSTRDLFLSAASQFYDPEIKAYEVTGNDFLLYPEEH